MQVLLLTGRNAQEDGFPSVGVRGGLRVGAKLVDGSVNCVENLAARVPDLNIVRIGFENFDVVEVDGVAHRVLDTDVVATRFVSVFLVGYQFHGGNLVDHCSAEAALEMMMAITAAAGEIRGKMAS